MHCLVINSEMSAARLQKHGASCSERSKFACLFLIFAWSLTVLLENRGSRIMKIGGVFSARCNIYISRLCYDVSAYVRLSVTEVHWRIINS